MYLKGVSLYFFMRTIKIMIEDEKFDALEKAKGKLTWTDFIMTLAGVKPKKKKNGTNYGKRKNKS